mmetsp:Transcript_6662/g.11652  ORF Transcript_6662/g.11652 Transcript_6662/m.11652 type:complete len:127 (-) Transcript_6662:51-431(-)
MAASTASKSLQEQLLERPSGDDQSGLQRLVSWHGPAPQRTLAACALVIGCLSVADWSRGPASQDALTVSTDAIEMATSPHETLFWSNGVILSAGAFGTIVFSLASWLLYRVHGDWRARKAAPAAAA